MLVENNIFIEYLFPIIDFSFHKFDSRNIAFMYSKLWTYVLIFFSVNIVYTGIFRFSNQQYSVNNSIVVQFRNNILV